MDKRKVLILSIFVIIITATITFSISNIVAIKTNSKVVISENRYDQLLELETKYTKAEGLQDYIGEKFYFPYDSETMMDGMLKGMFDALDDPYSVYMTKKEYEDFLIGTTGSYVGVGVHLFYNDLGQMEVYAPIKGSPAEKAGLQVGDIIIKVDELEVTKDNYTESADAIRGEVGTTVVLTVSREGVDDPIEMQIVRAQIEIENVESEMLDDHIGYLRIVEFDEDVSKDFKSRIKQLEKEGMTDLIIDLRNNPGGSVGEVIDIADQLMGKDLIVYTMDVDGNKDEFYSDSKDLDMPMVVLVNDNSASASEILAGALKDTETGIIVGTQTFGKGIIQIVKGLEDGSAIKMTTKGYYTPEGKSIHGVGIEPNVIVEQPESYYELDEPTKEDDVQLQKAIELLKEQER